MSGVHMLDAIVSALLGLLGGMTILAVLISVIRTFVVPRMHNVFLTRLVFINVGRLFRLWINKRKIVSYEGRDRVMSFFAPVALLSLPIVWVVYTLLGYMMLYWAMGVRPWSYAFTVSGSSLLTLGTTPFISLPITIVEFSEATLGLGLVALLLAYLPSIYAAFQRRESLVTMLEVRAGSPPSAWELITRAHRIRGLDSLHQTWVDWEVWFTELEESHTSLAPLIYFRSPDSGRSWVTAAGVILDSAALITSMVDVPPDAQAQLCIRSGYIALRRIAEFFNFPYERTPQFPQTPISISRHEFDDIYDQLSKAGVPLRADREQCWLDYAGWRVNYDAVLLFLARSTDAPYAPWVSDRSLPGGRTRVKFTWKATRERSST
ncbi:MAG: hypothetical protein K8L99_06590 [Anaerolineae bacterium]|nr:hypothetical protein [Anaerolineae bacterium]